MNACRVAVDIGGTFTDFVVQDFASGVATTGKLLSTPDNPARAVLAGLASFLPADAELTFLVHGTTIGLNSLLERRGARLALITTEGFRDVYVIAGNDRRDIFSLQYRKPPPLVTQESIFTVGERVVRDGSVLRRLDASELEPIAAALEERQTEAVAVCLLFSYLNPSHELEIERYLAERLPDVAVTLSHRVSPEWREYERTSTTLTNAYVAPAVTTYLSTLIDELEQRTTVALHVMQSNGGVMTARTARELPVQTLLSGPVGGAIGAQAICGLVGSTNLICVDMGGTSFDASLVVDGAASVSNETEVEGLPLQMASVDIHGIGAGGGSVAWLEGGALRVGPRSAGASPGPACYGRGGNEPTVTDANFVLGRIDERRFAGGGMALDLGAARQALAAVGGPLGLGVEAMAQGILDVVNAKMADAIRTITIQRGIDPREFSLVAFGGAGPMHAAALAGQLDVGAVVVPVHPGTFSAWGMLHTDVRHDLRRTFFHSLSDVGAGEVDRVFAELEAEGAKALTEEGVLEDAQSFQRAADLRYVGQEYALTVVTGSPTDKAAVREAFDAAYLRRYGHASPAAPAEIVKLRVVASGRVERPPDEVAPVASGGTSPQRGVFFDGTARPTPIVPRDELAPGRTIGGPAILEESTATTVVPPGWLVRVLVGGHLLMTREALP